MVLTSELMLKLAGLMKVMKEKGGWTNTKSLTNHSARKYLMQKLRSNNIQANDICQISCHNNVKSEENYRNMTEEKQKESKLVESLQY